ncbi:DEAD/DEAH box helicase family protein [Ferrimonas sp. YFM]|uniref:DEAD/DEAH box helicase n=1 Tax=Ferrimonas sp. YFM TaxID=3028878 RepID=UPI00257233FD|nr:DEAD/DEAH box helicase family protein [Ferrimonas sp. YFM]BDY07065.1 diguanylate cyclase [Ferrimonas sp. YFM]
MGLRRWQGECVQAALRKFQTGQKHFFCLASPGSGKTLMAAEVTARMLDANQIDLVIAFSPSLVVAEGIRSTFESRLSRRMDGLLGAVGRSLTYHSMSHLPDNFWSIIRNHRTLVIFDEIHHCAGNELANTNSWGATILLQIQDQAAYTLALSGTPWRSDRLPVSLAKYHDDSNQVAYDYCYGMGQAVEDQVCRAPHIVLVDNLHITCGNPTASKQYSGIDALLEDKALSYQALLNDPKFVGYVLEQGHKKLQELKQVNKEAAGLVVASSIAHATYIHHWLATNVSSKIAIVDHSQPNAKRIIEQFRKGEGEWIVSVGMISEGTDIPRLQVCCHLSRIRTEMYFRQVLGRVIRRTSAPNQSAWLFAANTANLATFSKALRTEIPRATLQTVHTDEMLAEDKEYDLQIPHSRKRITSNNPVDSIDANYIMKLCSATKAGDSDDRELVLSENFTKQLINCFQSPLYRSA